MTSCCLNPDCQNPQHPDGTKFCQSCGTQLVLLKNRYRPIQPLGGGGFGKTYLAEDIDKLNDRCVIKQLAPQVQGTGAIQKAQELFEQEAKRLQELGEHPQIPTLLAYFEETNRLYLVQQFIEGQTLQKELQEQGAFSEQKIRELLLDLLNVLKFVHQQNIIHRDIKPENAIRRQSDGKIVLIDFGVAKQGTATVLAKTGTVLGSFGYVAIEQMEGGKAYPASDFYSLGATCFYLLSEVQPWELWKKKGYSWVAQWRLYLKQPVSQQMERILSRLLQQDYRKRYQSVEEILADLHSQQPPIAPRTAIQGRQANPQTATRQPPPPPPPPPPPTQLSQKPAAPPTVVSSPSGARKQTPATPTVVSPPSGARKQTPAPPTVVSPPSGTQKRTPAPPAVVSPPSGARKQTPAPPTATFQSKLAEIAAWMEQNLGFSGLSPNELVFWRSWIVETSGAVFLGWIADSMFRSNIVLSIAMGGVQWRLLKGRFSGANGWWVATMAGAIAGQMASGILGFILEAIVKASGINFPFYFWGYSVSIVGFLSLFFSISIAQWLVLQLQQVARANWWVIANIAGIAAGFVAGFGAIATGGSAGGLLGTAAFLFGFTGITGRVLILLLRPPTQIGAIAYERLGLTNTITVHTGAVWDLAISPDGQTIVSASRDNTLKVWDFATATLKTTLTGHTDKVISVAISPDGQTIISGSLDRTIKVWDIPTDTLKATLTGHTDAIYSVAISPDGQTIVSASRDNTLKVWNLATATLKATLTGHNQAISSIAISPDGQTLVSGSDDTTIKVWNLATGTLKATLIGHKKAVFSVAISPDGQTIVSGSDDTTIKVWNLPTGILKNTLIGHTRYVNSVAISPDGQTIFSGSNDTTIKVWNLPRGTFKTTLKGHTNEVRTVAISPDGKTLLSGSDDNSIKMWKVV